MRNMRTALVSFSSLFLLAACSGEEMASSEPMPAPTPPTADEVLADVQAALGTENLSSITVSGDAWSIRNSFRQTRTASPPWFPRNEIIGYTQTIDLDAGTSLARGEFFAQNLFYDPPTWQNYTQYATADDGWSAQLNTWLTPWGFIQGAETNGATLSMEDGQPVLSWMSPASVTSPSGMQYTVNAYINEDNLIEKTETWVEDAFMGDMHVSFMFSNYEEMDGVMVPTTIERWQGGGAIFGIGLTDADANPANLMAALTPPENTGGGFGGGGNNGPAPAPADLVEEVAPGVWQITGGYGSFVIEFEDDLVVFESGQSPQRGEVILEAVASISDKPIRFLINSHPHSAHTAGLIPILRAGIPLMVSENSLDFMSMALNTPRTLLGEDPLNPEFEVAPAGEITVLEDDMNRLEIHHIPGLHTDSLLFLYMPEHSLAMQADFTVRGSDGNTLPYEGQTPLAREIAEYINESGMQFDTMLGVHASPYPQGLEDVLMAVPEDER